ncbi:MAG: hypothetical protein IJV31_09720 [Clostridia bacterium]|nr:hypothetical protein [Clostridia bacterium]
MEKFKIEGGVFMSNFEERGEDATKYGEFVSSYFGWVSLESQKEIAEKLEKMTKKEKNARK